jgi:hypothetical protein
MSKQDIEKRLGFAAQGVKAEFGSNDPYMQERTVKTRKGKTTDLVAEIGQNGGGGDYIATLMLVHSNGEPQVLQSKYGYKTPESATRAAIRLFDAHVSRGGYARSGAKAKMGLEMNMLDFRHKFFTAFGAAIRDAKSNPNTVEAQSDEAVLRESWASMFAQGYSDAISDLSGLSATMKSKTSVSQMRKAASDAMETYRQAKAAVRAARPGVKAKFADAALNQIRNNAAISDKILTLVSKGLSVPQAIDSVLGEGTYKRIGSEVYDELKKAKSSRPGTKAKMGSSQVNDSATTADLIREAQRLRDVIKTSNREFDKTHLRQIKQELDKRGVLMPYGASEVLASRSGMKAKA